MSYGDAPPAPEDPGPFSRGKSDAEVNADFMRFWAGVAKWPWAQIVGWGVVAFIAWQWFGGLLIWLALLGAVATLAYTYRDTPLLRWALDRIMALWLWALQRVRGYSHAFEKTAHVNQLAATTGELKRMAEAESVHTTGAQIFLAESRPAMEERLATLLSIPKPTTAQHKERAAIEAWIREDRKRAGELVDPAAFAAAIPAPAPPAGVFSIVSGFVSKWALWICGGLVLALGFQTVRAEHLKNVAQRAADEVGKANATIDGLVARIDRDATRIDMLNIARAQDAERFAETEQANTERLAAERARQRALASSLRRLENARAEMGAGGAPVDFSEQLRELVPEREAGGDPAGDAPGPGAADPAL